MTGISTALEVSLTGLVQGVGMRPMIYRLSQSNGLTGEVFNCGGEVTIRWFVCPFLGFAHLFFSSVR